MKKLSLFLFALMLSMVLAACNGEENTADNTETENKEATTEKETEETTEKETPEKETEEPTEDQVADDKVVAMVNDTEIKGSDYNTIYSQTKANLSQGGEGSADPEKVKKQTLETLINQQLLIQDAKASDITADEKKVQQTLKEFKGQYENDKKYEEALAQVGFTEEKLKTEIANELIIRKYIETELPETKVTDEQVQAFYDQYAKANKDAPPLKEMKEPIKQQLVQQERNKQLSKVIETLREKAEIETLI